MANRDLPSAQNAGPTVGRRALFAAPSVAFAALALGSGPAAAASASGAAKGDETFTTPANAIVETTAGKIRGYREGGVFTFKGVPYGASTAAEARFLPPRPPERWAGVLNTMVFGPICPQYNYRGGSDGPELLRQDQYEFESEDCLKLNVWTPSINDGARRPVMVWFHGGAFLNGSANRPSTWGHNLARLGDVVLVSVHHRLNVLGHLDLSTFGEQYKDSANAGALDMVAALQWVRDNIAKFGGDPGSVTIFGQSGGGAKVATLMVMPPARGLFHRAIVESSSSRISDTEQAERLSAKFLREVGVDRSSLSKLQTMPVDALVQAGVAVAAAPLNPGDDWRPKVDGRVVLQQPFDPSAPRLSYDIPVIVGGTRHEFAPPPVPIPEQELMDGLTKRFGAMAAQQLRAFFAKEYPGISTNEVLALVNVQPYRANHLKNATRLAERNAAPAYYYIFAWKTPNLDGLPLAYHSSEVPFVFGNVAECAPLTTNSQEAYALSDVIRGAWLAFAKTGDPNHGGMPHWPKFDPARGNTMVFDSDTKLIDHPWRSETEAVIAAAGGMFDKPSAEALGRPERSAPGASPEN